VRIGRMRATESLNLKIRNVVGFAEEGGFELRIVRVRWRLFRPAGTPLIESIRVDGWSATLAQDAEGRWHPSRFDRKAREALELAGLGMLLPLSSAGLQHAAAGRDAPTDGASLRRPPLPRLEMRKGTANVVDAQGHRLADATGLEVAWNSMQPFENRPVSHLSVRVAELRMGEGAAISNLNVEWIDTGERRFLATLEADDWGGFARPVSAEEEYRALFDAMD
jgi:hypothetical protein